MSAQVSLRGCLQGHNGWVTSIAASPADANTLVSSSRDHTCLVWNLHAGDLIDDPSLVMSCGTPVKSLKGHSHIVEEVSLSVDGQYALTASWDGWVTRRMCYRCASVLTTVWSCRAVVTVWSSCGTRLASVSSRWTRRVTTTGWRVCGSFRTWRRGLAWCRVGTTRWWTDREQGGGVSRWCAVRLCWEGRVRDRVGPGQRCGELPSERGGPCDGHRLLSRQLLDRCRHHQRHRPLRLGDAREGRRRGSGVPSALREDRSAGLWMEPLSSLDTLITSFVCGRSEPPNKERRTVIKVDSIVYKKQKMFYKVAEHDQNIMPPMYSF